MNRTPKTWKSAVVTADALAEKLDSKDGEAAREKLEAIEQFLNEQEDADAEED